MYEDKRKRRKGGDGRRAKSVQTIRISTKTEEELVLKDED